MFNLFRKLVKNARVNFRRVAFEGISLTLILTFLIVILISNVVRVVSNGKRNYEIYLSEKQSLEEIRKKNEDLENFAEVSQTDEYLIILARDILNLGFPDENLATAKQVRDFYQIEKKLLKVEEKEDYKDWWHTLFR